MGRRRGLELWRRNTIRTITMLSHAEGLLGSDARMPLSRGSVYGSTLQGGGRLCCHWGGLSGARARGPGLESQLCLHIDSYGRSVSHVWDKDRPEGAYQEGGLQACSWVCERGRPTFFKQDTFEQGVLVAQHQAFISGATMILLKGLQGVFIALNGGLELADVLCATLTEGGLGLAVALLPLLRGSINLTAAVSFMPGKEWDQGSR